MMYLLTMGWFLAHTSLAMTPGLASMLAIATSALSMGFGRITGQ